MSTDNNLPHKVLGTEAKNMSTATVDVVVTPGSTFPFQMMVPPVILLKVPFLKTTLMWMKTRIIGPRTRM